MYFVLQQNHENYYCKIYLKFLDANVPTVLIDPKCIKSDPSPSMQKVLLRFEIEYPKATDDVWPIPPTM